MSPHGDCEGVPEGSHRRRADQVMYTPGMAVWYELWDVDTGNIVGTYTSEADALAEVRGLLAVNGASYADDLSLGRKHDDRGELIAEGFELAQLAEAARPGRRSA